MTIPKFRAWLKDEQRMIESYDTLAIDYENEEIVTQKVYFERGLAIERDIHSYDFDDVNLMQLTGLTDKNGKEIFDGDVLKTYDGELAKVVWNKYLGCWEAEFLSEIVDLSEVADIKSNRSDCEIFGNIYENPELLEGEE
ncbi:YopX family protein [Streptococcus pasteurianus]|nr:YopX protein [Streptococcus pasteurianus]